jgi:hypothetical protein
MESETIIKVTEGIEYFCFYYAHESQEILPNAGSNSVVLW